MDNMRNNTKYKSYIFSFHIFFVHLWPRSYAKILFTKMELL